MRGSFLSSPLDVHDEACRIDSAVRSVLTVLSMEMNWDYPVDGYCRPFRSHIGVAALWSAGERLKFGYAQHMAFRAVTVRLWWNYRLGWYLEVVTGCRLPPAVAEIFYRSLEEAADLPLRHREDVERANADLRGGRRSDLAV